MEPSGADFRSSSMPSNARPTVALSKYRYTFHSTPASVKMFLWLPLQGASGMYDQRQAYEHTKGANNCSHMMSSTCHSATPKHS